MCIREHLVLSVEDRSSHPFRLARRGTRRDWDGSLAGLPLEGVIADDEPQRFELLCRIVLTELQLGLVVEVAMLPRLVLDLHVGVDIEPKPSPNGRNGRQIEYDLLDLR